MSYIRQFDNSVEVDRSSAGAAAGTPDTVRAHRVRIYREARSATQQGAAGRAWRLAFDKRSKWKNALMGWTSSDETVNQVHLSFKTKQEAVDFATGQGMQFEVEEEQTRKIVPKSYAYNYDPKFYGIDVAKK